MIKIKQYVQPINIKPNIVILKPYGGWGTDIKQFYTKHKIRLTTILRWHKKIILNCF